jgi:hypothetical protein
MLRDARVRDALGDLTPRDAARLLVSHHAGSVFLGWTNGGLGSTGRQHPGFHLQIVVLALPCDFFLMRFEIAYALSDFVAL